MQQSSPKKKILELGWSVLARCNSLSTRSKLPLDGVSCATSLREQLPRVRCLHVNDVFTRSKGRGWLGIGAVSLIRARLDVMPPLAGQSGRDSVDRGQATCGCEIHSALHGQSVPIHFSAAPEIPSPTFSPTCISPLRNLFHVSRPNMTGTQ
ncbi:hypothetical protein WH47_10209 [Habropoda laboriosa]|uniref:Uncharacterized protein n=1 Tax=Habropoda laboriosa TaxID=597456 RepID=A0A0L7R4E1_9HYME|nr:hypothetical protein WH47_10209 [Habropoda laboriosa]